MTKASLAAAALVLGLLAGCGADNDDDGGVEDPTSGATSEASDGATNDTSATDETSDTAAAESYLEVPAGVELTPPGTTLKLGDRGVVAWEPRQGAVAAIEATVTRLARTTFEHSFQGWQIDDETAKLTPYFVNVRVSNAGDRNLGGLAVPMYATDDKNTLVEASAFQGNFKPCPGGVLPKKFRQGAKADLCFVYLLSPGRELEAVSFTPPAGVEPISWSGKVGSIAPQKKGGKKGGRG